jgi:lysozyme
MQINKAGLTLIKQFEGCRLTAYKDQVGRETIGWGHTGDVTPNEVITQDRADSLLEEDLVNFEMGVEDQLERTPTQNQFAAMVSFAYNLGLGNFMKSTLLTKFNEGDILGAADQFLRWNRAGGVEDPGLTRRREAERELFLT